MARFELSITADYAPSWGLWEGLREAVQNGLDSRDKGYPLHVEHKDGALHIRNEGCQLDTAVWLLGHSSKRGDSSQRGQHGDGLKVGTLAMVRRGVEVKIFNGDEIWTPCLETSRNYAGQTVLAVKTRKRRQDYWGDRPTSDFTVVIKISKADWLSYRDRFLDLVHIPDHEIARASWRGSVLLGIEMQGRIYSKGIYVCTKPDLLYGYNFEDLDLDRDRRMVDDWNLHYQVAYLMQTLCGEGEENRELWLDRLWTALEDGSNPDLNKLGSVGDDAICQAMAATFASLHGDKAVPVANDDEATKVSFYGLRGIVVPTAMGEVLKNTFGDIDTILRNALDTSGVYVRPEDMSPEERVNWTKAINLCDYADIADSGYLQNNVKCYSYDAEDAPLGTHHNGEERINRCLLGNLRRLVGVIIHEIAHNAGKDGTLAHRQTEESMYEAVMGCLLDMAGTEWLLD
jgi:hypothetical protein